MKGKLIIDLRILESLFINETSFTNLIFWQKQKQELSEEVPLESKVEERIQETVVNKVANKNKKRVSFQTPAEAKKIMEDSEDEEESEDDDEPLTMEVPMEV